jgi:hypothetical protein
MGCTSASRVSVKGKVTYDGQTVDEGNIEFLPEGGTASVKLAAPIENGQYEIPPDRGGKVGAYRVEIHWAKKTGREIPSADPGMTVPERQEGLPARFHAESTLRRDFKSGENLINFDLTSK